MNPSFTVMRMSDDKSVIDRFLVLYGNTSADVVADINLKVLHEMNILYYFPICVLCRAVHSVILNGLRLTWKKI